MKECKICGREHRAKGLCANHYSQLSQFGKTCTLLPRPSLRKYKKCKIKKCKREHYQHNYCKKHWAYYSYIPKCGRQHKCKIKGCNYGTITKYCQGHLFRIKNHLSLNLSMDFRGKHLKGKNNPNWRGGIADYPNHWLMKKNRLIILMQNPKCEKCGKPATEIHHKDGSKINHQLSNLMAICHPCNSKIRFKPNNTEFYKQFGISSYQMAKRLNISYINLYNWRQNGIWNSIIASNPKIFIKK